MNTEQRIEARVTLQQKEEIVRIANKCRLPLSEYIRQRALGYSPCALQPDIFYEFYNKLCELCNSIDDGDTEEKLLRLIDDIRLELIFPRKESIAAIKSGLERDEKWLPRDSGRLKEA